MDEDWIFVHTVRYAGLVELHSQLLILMMKALGWRFGSGSYTYYSFDFWDDLVEERYG